MADLVDRLIWIFNKHLGQDPGLVIEALLREVETTHYLIDPDKITATMLQACYLALPEHYDPPDPKRLPWHAFKAKRRFTAMVKAAPKIVEK